MAYNGLVLYRGFLFGSALRHCPHERCVDRAACPHETLGFVGLQAQSLPCPGVELPG